MAEDGAAVEVVVGAKGTRYENWVPAAAIVIAAFFALLSGVLAVLAATVVPSEQLLVLYVVVCLVCVVLLALLCVMRHACSFSGGKLMGALDAHLLQHVQLDGQQHVLDVGCGSGARAVRSAKAGPGVQVTGVDAFDEGAPATAAWCEANAQAEGVAPQCAFVQVETGVLPFDDASFDVVVLDLACHALPGADKALLVQESLRVLKPGGQFALLGFPGKKGDPDLSGELANAGASEVHSEGTLGSQGLIPRYMFLPVGLRKASVLWGVK